MGNKTKDSGMNNAFILLNYSPPPEAWETSLSFNILLAVVKMGHLQVPCITRLYRGLRALLIESLMFWSYPADQCDICLFSFIFVSKVVITML